MMAIKVDIFTNLQAEMRSCRKCLANNYWIAPEAVTQGTVDAKIMTIGQAPGITEVEAKRPFNAGSGKRLFEWLGKAGIEEVWFRNTQYMTSVTKCYPGRAKSGSGDRVPSRGEQKLCREFLDSEMKLIEPKLVIPIGRLAIEMFYSKTLKLNEIIGTEKEIDYGGYVVPFPHTSGASRWHQIAENRMLITKAIGLIKGHYQKIFN